MPRPNYKNCTEWIAKVQESEGPEEPFLLGFGTEVRRSIRSYMRDLWLPFSNTLSVMPTEWHCLKAEEFAAEISQRVNEFVNEDAKLGNELDGIHYTLSSEDLQKREPFEAVAHELLITREWGDNLWGHRKYCFGPLANPNREVYTPEPKWPRDQERITLAVRRWIAAQIQWKIEAPRKKGNKVVPPVENAPDDAEARRAEIHAGSRTEKEDSEDEDRPYGPWSQPRNLKEENSPSPSTERLVHLRTLPRTTRARAAQQIEGSQPTSATRSKKRMRQVSTSNLMKEDPPSLLVQHPIPLQTAIPRTTRSRAAQQTEESQPISAASSKKRKRQRPSTRRSKTLKVSTDRPQHEDYSEQHTLTLVPNTAIDSGVALSMEGPPTEVTETILSETTNGDDVEYHIQEELIVDNTPSIASFPSEASSSQQGEEAVLCTTLNLILDDSETEDVAIFVQTVLCEPNPTPSLIVVGHHDLKIEEEVIFVKEAPVLPRLGGSVVALDAQDHVITIEDTQRASPDPSASITFEATEYSTPSPLRARVVSEDVAIPTAEPDATQAFLEEIARSPSRTGTKNHITWNDAMIPAPLTPVASSISLIAAPRLPVPELEPLSGFTIPLMLASPVLNPPRDPRGFANPKSRRTASRPPASQPPPSNPKFPPGSSKVPRRCSQCDHSLDELVDIMTDSGGFAQWKKKCTYCRREVGRPNPCMCYRCQSRTEENVNELPTQATLSTGHVDVPTQTMLSADPTLAPLVGQSSYGWPLTSFLDDLTRDTIHKPSASNDPASIADARQQLATTDRDITPINLDLRKFHSSDLDYYPDSDVQQENIVVGQDTHARRQPTAPAYLAPAPYETYSVYTSPSSARLPVTSLQMNPSYPPTSNLSTQSTSIVPTGNSGDLPTPSLSSQNTSLVSTGNSKWSSPVIPKKLAILDDADWVIDERPELTRAMRQILQNWGSGWRAKLQAGGALTDSRPNEQLAKSLARLSSFERNIKTLLNSLSAFRKDPAYINRGAGSRPQPHSGLFGAYDGLPRSMSATEFDDWRSFLSMSKKYMYYPAR